MWKEYQFKKTKQNKLPLDFYILPFYQLLAFASKSEYTLLASSKNRFHFLFEKSPKEKPNILIHFAFSFVILDGIKLNIESAEDPEMHWAYSGENTV